jgi:cytosine/adenosine deaminase-related metal-dependent hydrolase
MRNFSAQYVFTNDGPPLQRAIVCTEDDGTILSVEDTGGNLGERHSVEFYNGIIIPGLINCHCHLEFSYLKEVRMQESGLAGFLKGITLNRNNTDNDRDKAMAEADNQMAFEGIVACADICNTSASFELKKKSRIKYISLLEVYGFDAAKATDRIEEVLSLAQKASSMDLPYYIVPHSVYSVSNPLFRLIKELAANNKVSSVHFLESEDEKRFLSEHSGPLMRAYLNILAPGGVMDPPSDHLSAISGLVTRSGNLILVHNTAIEQFQIAELRKREDLWYCLCPNSNLYIENKLPPVSLLSETACQMVIGTDSLSSNKKLSMLSEMITLHQSFPAVSLENIIKWATINGAQAMGEDHWAGSITPGKKPGLVLISGCDLQNLMLLPSSSAVRLI